MVGKCAACCVRFWKCLLVADQVRSFFNTNKRKKKEKKIIISKIQRDQPLSDPLGSHLPKVSPHIPFTVFTKNFVRS